VNVQNRLETNEKFSILSTVWPKIPKSHPKITIWLSEITHDINDYLTPNHPFGPCLTSRSPTTCLVFFWQNHSCISIVNWLRAQALTGGVFADATKRRKNKTVLWEFVNRSGIHEQLWGFCRGSLNRGLDFGKGSSNDLFWDYFLETSLESSRRGTRCIRYRRGCLWNTLHMHALCKRSQTVTDPPAALPLGTL